MPIRVRLTALVTLGAAALCLFGAYLFVREFGESLRAALDARLQARATAVADALSAGLAVTELDVSPATAGGQMVAVLDSGGHVVASTSGFVPPRIPPQPAAAGLAVERDGLRAVSRRVDRPDGAWTVIVGEPTGPVDAATDQVTKELVAAALAIVAGAAAGSWWLAGRALRPVEELRAQA